MQRQRKKTQLRKERLAALKNTNLKPEENLNDISDQASDGSKSTSPQQVKNLLLKRLNNYKNNKNRYTINANAVKRFRIIGNEAYCDVQCPFCEVKVPCTYV